MSYLSDEQITQEDHVASLDVQMQNINLQRQVQFLQKRVAESRPSSEKTRTNVKDPDYKRPITTKPADNYEITKRKNEIGADHKNSLDKIEDNRRKIVTSLVIQ